MTRRRDLEERGTASSLAVNSIGYEDVEHVWLPRYNGDWDRWAEFIIIINEDVANPQPTSTANLIREVRDKKESTSKDNYLIRYYADVWNKLISEMDTTYLLRSHFYKQRYLDGSRKLDGSRTLSYSVGQIELLPDYLFQTETQVSFMVQAFTEYTALAEHKTVQDQEYEVLMNARYLRNTDVLVSLASDFLFRVRETWKWHPEARNEYHMAARQEQDITPVYGIRDNYILPGPASGWKQEAGRIQNTQRSYRKDRRRHRIPAGCAE